MIRINGKEYEGSSVVVTNGHVIIDGNVVTDESLLKEILKVEVHGTIGEVRSDKSVSVVGTIKGNVYAGGAVSCDDIGGNVEAGGSVSADNVGGNVTAGGSVSV